MWYCLWTHPVTESHLVSTGTLDPIWELSQSPIWGSGEYCLPLYKLLQNILQQNLTLVFRVVNWTKVIGKIDALAYWFFLHYVKEHLFLIEEMAVLTTVMSSFTIGKSAIIIDH